MVPSRVLVKDSFTSQLIEAATVSVFLLADSSLISYVTYQPQKANFLLWKCAVASPCQLRHFYSGLRSITFLLPYSFDSLLSSIPSASYVLLKAASELEEV